MRRLLSLVPLALAAGCTVGPDYAGPSAAPPPARFVRGGDAVAAGGPQLALWWESLGDPTLSDLETRALAANPDLAAAQARVRQARAAFRQERANRLPSANASALYAHAHIPGLDLQDGGASDLDLYNLGFDASWEVDLFGGERRKIEAARAQAEAAQARLADAQVSLTAEVAQAYVNLRDRQRRIALSAAQTARQERMLALTRQRFDRGTASRIDVERLSQRLDATRAQATPLSAERDAYLDALAVLTGAEPGALDAILTPAGASPPALPRLPAQVTIGDPAALIRQRPDIRAAERALAADTAKIGQAQAARFPRLSFMGIIGIGGSSPSDITNLSDVTTLLAPQLSWSLLDFGRNAAKLRQAEGVRDETEAKYRAAVLAALRDAEDSLSRFAARRGTVAQLARAERSAQSMVTLSDQRYRAGTTTLIDLLDTERQALAATQDLTEAQAALVADYVAIQKALGLGWTMPAGIARAAAR